MIVLFKTVHGSRLYGLHHEHSDQDFYTVVSKVKTARAKYSTHKITGSMDSVVVDFGTWLGQCEKGVPQALEAMFSSTAIVDRIEPLRKNYVVGTAVYDTYLRTIKSFAMSDEYKKRRHALRLAYNLRDIRQRGRFDPHLSESAVRSVSALAYHNQNSTYYLAKSIAWS